VRGCDIQGSFKHYMTPGHVRTPGPTAVPDSLRFTKLALGHGSGAIPALGFGTLIPDPVATRNATRTALEAGLRALDASERYRTEKEVGEAMKEVFAAGDVKREDVFVATKLWNTNHRPERVKPAFEASLRKLQLDYVDLYLIHTPFAFQPGDEQDPRDAGGNVIYDQGVKLTDTWGALEKLVDEGKSESGWQELSPRITWASATQPRASYWSAARVVYIGVHFSTFGGHSGKIQRWHTQTPNG
jgi:aryl-alcohol dehydrogenase-like predicted oxidoreductase